jgi:pimeloyl-ACP methyl ester carboxylesterase
MGASGGVSAQAGRLDIRKKLVPYTSTQHGEEGFINTLIATSEQSSEQENNKKPPLVLLHGYGAAMGFYVANIEPLSRHYDVYAIDLPLFGQSSRHKIVFAEENAKESADYFVDALFDWKKNVGL